MIDIFGPLPTTTTDLPRSFDLFAPTRTFVSYDSPRDSRYSGFSLSLRFLFHRFEVAICVIGPTYIYIYIFVQKLCWPCSFDRRFDKRRSRDGKGKKGVGDTTRVELVAFRDSLRISSFLLPPPSSFFSFSLSFFREYESEKGADEFFSKHGLPGEF